MTAIESGGNPVLVKRGIDVAVARLVEHLAGVAHPLRTEDDFRRVAAISANDDETIGGAVARALYTVGDGGVVTVEDSAVLGIDVDFVEDFEFDNGYVSPYMVTDVGRLEAVVEDCYVLLTAHKITDVKTLMPVLDSIMRAPKPLVIVAESVEGTALQMLVRPRSRTASGSWRRGGGREQRRTVQAREARAQEAGRRDVANAQGGVRGARSRSGGQGLDIEQRVVAQRFHELAEALELEMEVQQRRHLERMPVEVL